MQLSKVICILLFLLGGGQYLYAADMQELKKKYHQIDAKVWTSAVATVKVDLNQKFKKRPYKHKIDQAHLAWLQADKLKLQTAPLKLKLMNHIMGAPRDDILKSFVSRRSIARIKSFMLEHEQSLRENEKKYKVEATGVVGVLYIETAFNASYVKYYPALDTLMTLAALLDDTYRQQVLDQTMLLSKAYDPPEKWTKRAEWDARAVAIGERWADELASLLALSSTLSWEKPFVLNLESSWAGAIGYSQFMPATALKQIKSKDFDFWSWQDSIEFTSRELSHHHWSRSPKQALMKYNQVSWYGETVLAIHEAVSPWWRDLEKAKKDSKVSGLLLMPKVTDQ